MTYFDATSNLNFLLFSLNKGLFSIWGKGKIDMLKALVQWLLLDTKNKGGYTATNEKNILSHLLINFRPLTRLVCVKELSPDLFWTLLRQIPTQYRGLLPNLKSQSHIFGVEKWFNTIRQYTHIHYSQTD